MAVTTLDPKTALVVIDLQKGIVSLSHRASHRRGREAGGSLTEAFRRRGLPVVLVNVAAVRRAGRNDRDATANFPPAGPISSPS